MVAKAIMRFTEEKEKEKEREKRREEDEERRNDDNKYRKYEYYRADNSTYGSQSKTRPNEKRRKLY